MADQDQDADENQDRDQVPNQNQDELSGDVRTQLLAALVAGLSDAMKGRGNVREIRLEAEDLCPVRYTVATIVDIHKLKGEEGDVKAALLGMIIYDGHIDIQVQAVTDTMLEKTAVTDSDKPKLVQWIKGAERGRIYKGEELPFTAFTTEKVDGEEKKEGKKPGGGGGDEGAGDDLPTSA